MVCNAQIDIRSVDGLSDLVKSSRVNNLLVPVKRAFLTSRSLKKNQRCLAHPCRDEGLRYAKRSLVF